MLNFGIREASTEDGVAVWQLVRSIGTLDLSSCYAYLMWCTYFRRFTQVAEVDEAVEDVGKGRRILGFISGFITPERTDTLFIWQIGVDPKQRTHGIASRLLQALVTKSVAQNGISAFEATICPSNTASRTLFECVAKSFNAPFVYQTLFPKEHFPEGNHEEDT